MHKFIQSNSFLSTKTKDKAAHSDTQTLKNTTNFIEEKHKYVMNYKTSKYIKLLKQHQTLLQNISNHDKTNQFP